MKFCLEFRDKLLNFRIMNLIYWNIYSLKRETYIEYRVLINKYKKLKRIFFDLLEEKVLWMYILNNFILKLYDVKVERKRIKIMKIWKMLSDRYFTLNITLNLMYVF